MSVIEMPSPPVKSSLPTAAPIRVAVIGCGAIAEQMHLPVLAGHRTLKLAALVDRDSRRLQKFGAGYGVAQLWDDAARLTRADVDAAIVATPPQHHASCTIDLLEKGIHVLVEKPMATSLADAERMVAASRRSGAVLAVGFFRRLYPSLRLMKSLLDSGWAGPPQRFRVEGGGMYNWAAATLGNMRRDLAGGGVLIDFGSHMLDLMFALFQEPVEIRAYRDNARGGIESDCIIDVAARYGDRDVPGRIELARTRELGSLVRVECERATLEFQAGERFRVRVEPHDASLIDPASGESRTCWMNAAWADGSQDESWYATFGRQYDDWTHAIRTGVPAELSGDSALATSRLIDACYRQPTLMAEPWVDLGLARLANAAESKDLAPGQNGQRESDSARTPKVHVAGREKKILLTGATGFIGGRVAEMLRLGMDRPVRAVVHNPGNASRLARLDLEMVQADLGDPAAAAKLVAGCDAVIHCAIGTSYGEPHKIASVTVGGTQTLARAAGEAGLRRFVHVSTMSVYGDDGMLTGVIDESRAAQPVRGNLYGETKSAAEEAILAATRQGLCGVIFRPARVYGPFAKIFIMRPLQAMRNGNFQWLGSPDVPADMVYVDNVAAALLAAVDAPAEAVAGQAFNIGEESRQTWREFYASFADPLGLDLDRTTTAPLTIHGPPSTLRNVLGFPGRLFRGAGQIVTSAEFKSLGRRVLYTDPIGTLPRKAVENLPWFEKLLRRIVRADDSLPVYVDAPPAPADMVQMGSGGSVLSIAKLRQRIGFALPAPHDEAIAATLAWVRHARIV